jgi:hypothetical protein
LLQQTETDPSIVIPTIILAIGTIVLVVVTAYYANQTKKLATLTGKLAKQTGNLVLETRIVARVPFRPSIQVSHTLIGTHGVDRDNVVLNFTNIGTGAAARVKAEYRYKENIL